MPGEWVRPCLATLGDPRSHGGVEGLSGNGAVLPLGVQHVVQGGQLALVRGLGCHVLKVLHNPGHQNLSWENNNNTQMLNLRP